jgi:hypothetical protein|nr:MAG TPA: hemolytic protein [Caudoviricetes sp.]
MTKVDEAIENIIEYAQNHDISVERNREKFEFLLELYYDARREETDWAEEVERQEAMEFAECFSESE